MIWAGHLTLNLFFHCKKSVDNHSYFAGLLWGLKERNIASILYGSYFKIISHLLPHYPVKCPQITQKHRYCAMPKRKINRFKTPKSCMDYCPKIQHDKIKYFACHKMQKLIDTFPTMTIIQRKMLRSLYRIFKNYCR